jgi:hypothetical protein
VKRIKDYSKEGPGSFPRRDNHRNAKIGWDHFEIFLRTTDQKSSYLHKSFLIYNIPGFLCGCIFLRLVSKIGKCNIYD